MDTPASVATDLQPEFFSAQITRARRFCLELDPPPAEPLVVVCGGREHCTADYEIHRTNFPYYAIEFVAHGRGAVTLRQKTYPLIAGTLFAYGPGIHHDIVPDRSETTIKYFVNFAGREAARLLRRHGLPPGTALQTRAPNDILALFDDLIHNGLRRTPFTARIATLILRHLLLKVEETAAPPGSIDPQAFATYMRCKQYIEERWAELATIEQAAQACDLDVAYVCRLFRRFDHQSPYQYLMSLRMSDAVDRLRMSGTTVKRVAEDMGFADQFHFSRAFKRVFGLSPGQFRRSLHRA
jgi:AraC-like DNA-binding protein